MNPVWCECLCVCSRWVWRKFWVSAQSVAADWPPTQTLDSSPILQGKAPPPLTHLSATNMKMKVKVEPCCDCPQSEPDCVCVSDVSSCCFTRRRTSRVTSSTRPGEPTCPLQPHLLSQRVMTGSDSPFYSSVLVLWFWSWFCAEVQLCVCVSGNPSALSPSPMMENTWSLVR